MDAITSTTLQPLTNTATAPQEEVGAQGTQTATTTAAGGDKPAVVVDLSPAAQNVTFLKDLPEEDQQRILQMRAKQDARFAQIEAQYADNPSVKDWVSRGRLQGLAISSTDTETKILTEDDRIITRPSHKRNEDAIAHMQAIYAQRDAEMTRRSEELKALQPLQAEWEAKWKTGQQVWTGPMTATESTVAQETATVEHMLSSIRGQIGDLHSATAALRQDNPWDAELYGDSVAQRRAEAPAKIARAEASLAEMQDQLQNLYGFKLEGNLVEKTADGFTREGRYTLTKTTGAWSIKADSKEGVSVSIGGQPYTRDIKRLAVIDPGAVNWLLQVKPAAEPVA